MSILGHTFGNVVTHFKKEGGVWGGNITNIPPNKKNTLYIQLSLYSLQKLFEKKGNRIY